MATHLYDIRVNDKSGNPVSLEAYRGNAILIVNVASACGFTPQYEGLEKLYRDYRDQGLVILGFPCNDFGQQESGSMAEIEQFCKLNYGITFPLFEKLHCIGDQRHPLYSWLVSRSETGEDVKWNFEKFLVGKNGELIARFPSKTEPHDESLIQAIEKQLA